MKNKKGQLGIAIITSIILIIIGFMCINFIKDEVTRARTDLNCSSADDISDSTKLLCLVIDSVVPYWIVIILSITIGVITERLAL